jgi:hypothetical protein
MTIRCRQDKGESVRREETERLKGGRVSQVDEGRFSQSKSATKMRLLGDRE